MITFKQLKQLCSDYPNDMKLGEHIRSMYWNTANSSSICPPEHIRSQPTQGMYIPSTASAVDDAAEVMRESAAQQSITEGTTLTTGFSNKSSKDYTINPEVQLEIDFK